MDEDEINHDELGGSASCSSDHGGDRAAELPISDSYESGFASTSRGHMSVSNSVIEDLNAMRIERDVESETKDLFISVDNPEKHNTAFDSYITFKITTKTTRCDYDNSEYTVRRRYNDFVWLRKRLEQSHSAHLVPPLPEKHRSRLDRYTLEFLRLRMVALNKFLSRVADHPVLSYNKSYKTFLTANWAEFQSYKKSGVGLMKALGESVHNMATSYMMKERPAEFDQINQYVNKFGDKFGVIERIASRINVENQAYASQLCQLSPVYLLWSSSESGPLSQPLDALGRAVDTVHRAITTVLDSYELKIALPIREYCLYSDAIKAVLKRRDAFQIEYELTVDELQKKKEEREVLKSSDQSYTFGAFIGKDPEEIRREKQEKVTHHIAELTRQVDENNDQLTCANADLSADMDRWRVTKRHDVKRLLLNMAQLHIDYYQQCIDAWQSVLPSISPTSQNTSESNDDNEGGAAYPFH